MRTNGNLALDSEYQHRHADLRKAPEMKLAERPKEKARNINVAVVIFYVVIIFAIAFCLISREVNLYEKSGEISRLENQLEQVQSETKQAKIASEKVVDLKSIEEAATNKFAMSRPEKTQTVYINIQHGDYVEKAAKKNAGVELQQSIQNSIKNLFGIFGVN